MIPKNRICPQLQREPEGYDSVFGQVGDFSELAVYSNDRVLITHVIGYQSSAVAPAISPLSRLASDATRHIQCTCRVNKPDTCPKRQAMMIWVKKQRYPLSDDEQHEEPAVTPPPVQPMSTYSNSLFHPLAPPMAYAPSVSYSMPYAAYHHYGPVSSYVPNMAMPAASHAVGYYPMMAMPSYQQFLHDPALDLTAMAEPVAKRSKP